VEPNNSPCGIHDFVHGSPAECPHCRAFAVAEASRPLSEEGQHFLETMYLRGLRQAREHTRRERPWGR
jgi:hypothetical protein